MSIKVRCGNCRKSFRVDEKFAGETVKCPFCPEAVEIPAIEYDGLKRRIEIRLEETGTAEDNQIAAGLTNAQRRLKSSEQKARTRQTSLEHLVEGLLLDDEQVLHFSKPNWVILASRMTVNAALFVCLIAIDIAVLFPENPIKTIVWVAIHLAIATVIGWLMYRAWSRTVYILTSSAGLGSLKFRI